MIKSFIILLTCFALPCLGKQLLFEKKAHETGYRFNYQWLDHKQMPRSLSFDLSHQVLFEQYRNFRAYQKNLAQSAINKYVYLTWQQTPIKHSQLSLLKRHGQYQLSLSANNQKALAKAQQQLNKLQQQGLTQYLQQEHYQEFITPHGEAAIKPDHSAIAQSMVDNFKSIKALILEQDDLQNIRTATNYVLGFVQAIPYNPLNSRVTSSGAGFNPPNKLLWQNQGDCDSKVTLTAALLRALMPRVKIVLVFIDQHAFIGIETRPEANDKTLEHDGITFVLAEPTGPASLALGKLAMDSEQAILNGMYVVENFYQQTP